MPRFPVIPQRTSAPAAFSNTPRAQAAHFGAGIGRSFAALGSEAVELGQEVEKRQQRQVEQALSRMDRETAKQRLESDAQAPPEETGESRIERYGTLFDSSADAVLKEFEGQASQERLREGIEARRETMMKSLLEREAQQRLRVSLKDTQALVGSWSGRVAQDPSQFEVAVLELLGDDAGGAAGLLNGLGLRPEALEAWKTYSLKRLLDAKATSDPSGLLSELETERWQELLSEDHRRFLIEDARAALRLKTSVQAIELGQQRAGKAQQLSTDIEAGRAGQAEIRRAEEEGTLSIPQAEALRGSAERAEVARQAQQVANDELALAMSGGVGFDLENPQNRQAADAFYEKTYSQALREGGPEEVLAQVASMVFKTGYLPPRLAKDNTGLLHSRDDTQRIAGAELYGRLREVAPSILPLAFDPETRARGGILKRWLDAGLEPEDALSRAEAEWPGDGSVEMLKPDDLSALKRDLETLFAGVDSERHAGLILDQLKQNYLDDLGRGLTTRQARRQLQRDVGRVIRTLSPGQETARANQKHSGEDRSSLLVPVRGPKGKAGSKTPGFPFVPYVPPDPETVNAAIRQLERYSRDAADWMIDAYLTYQTLKQELRSSIASPGASENFDGPSISIGGGESYPSKIQSVDEDVRARTLMFTHPELGDISVFQYLDLASDQYYSVEAGFADPETGNHVIEKLPSSRLDLRVEGSSEAEPSLWEGFSDGKVDSSETSVEAGQATVIPSGEHFPIIQPGPSAEPISVEQLPPSEVGPGLGKVPTHTGGNQTALGPRIDQPTGYPAQEQEPLILVTPDQSDDTRVHFITYNEEGTPVYDGIPISARFIKKAGKKHDKVDVWFDDKGYPIFDPYTIATVEIKLTGNREKDKRLATQKAIEKKLLPEIPIGYVWHHHQDMKTMQLVLKEIHDAVGHTGGFSNFLKREKKRAKARKNRAKFN